MGKVRAAAVVTVDHPDADGMLLLDGAGYTWRFSGREEDPYSTSAPWSPQWNYAAGLTEYLPEMRACAPRGYATLADMTLADWTVETGEGVWEEVAYPERKWLWLREVPAGGYGEITSNAAFYPHVALWLSRYAPAPDVTNAFTGLTLIQENGPLQVGYYLPMYSEGGENKYPQLRVAPKSRPSTEADTVEEWQGQGQGQGGAAYTISSFSIENTAGCLRVRWSEQGQDPWTYQPAGGIVLGPCKVVLTAYGHPLAFNAQQIRYPLSATATPYSLLPTPSWCNPAKTFYYLGWEPVGCGIVVAGVGGASENPDKPVVTFTSRGHDRAVCFLVTQQHDPIFTDPRTDPEDVSGEVLRASGHVDDSWRGSSCNLELLVDLDQYDAWKGNNKVQVDVGWQDETGGWESTLPWRQFTGYVTGLTRRVSAEYNGRKAVLSLRCEDWIAARGQGKKFMVNFPCEAGRDASLIAKYNLMRAGVAESMIATGAIPVANLPVAERPGEFLFDFAPETEVITAQDAIAQAVGCIFGGDQNGTQFVKPRPTYSGTPDLVLDEATATGHEIITQVTSERCHGELRNYVLALCGQGSGVASALAADVGSHREPTDPNFLGDAWWEVFTNADVPGSWALAMAQRRLAEAIKRGLVFTWETPGRDLWPDQFVEVNLEGVAVEPGTIFRISAKDWRLDKDSGRMELWDTYLCIKEADPAAGS